MAEELFSPFRHLELNDLADEELEPILVRAAAKAILDVTEPSTTTLALVCIRWSRIVFTERFSRLVRDEVRTMDPSHNRYSMMPLEVQGIDKAHIDCMTAMKGELFVYNRRRKTIYVYGHKKLSAAGNLLPLTEKSLTMVERRQLPITLPARSASDSSSRPWYLFWRDWFDQQSVSSLWKLSSCPANNSLYVTTTCSVRGGHQPPNLELDTEYLLRLNAMTGRTLAQTEWSLYNYDDPFSSLNITQSGHVLLSRRTAVHEFDEDLKLFRKLDIRQIVQNGIPYGIHKFEGAGNYLIWWFNLDMVGFHFYTVMAHTQLADGPSESAGTLVPLEHRPGGLMPKKHVDADGYALLCYENYDLSYHVELMGQDLRILRELDVDPADSLHNSTVCIDKECGLMYRRTFVYEEHRLSIGAFRYRLADVQFKAFRFPCRL